MAIVIGFEKDNAKNPRVHPTEVMVYWLTFDQGTGPILQLSSLKSGERQKSGLQSHTRQTLQFTQDGAHQLFEILKAKFKF